MAEDEYIKKSDLLDIKCDIAAWAVAFLSLFIYVNTGFLKFEYVRPFESMFASLGGELPRSTIILLDIGDPWIGVIILVLALSPLVACRYLKDSKIKLAVSVVVAFLYLSAVKLVMAGMFLPVLEAQSALS